MAFRARQKYSSDYGEAVMAMKEVTLESGVIVNNAIDMCKEKLPDAQLFNLEDQLKAGVMMDEVNSKVMKSGKVDVSKIINDDMVADTVTESEQVEE